MAAVVAYHSFGKTLTGLRDLIADSVLWQAMVRQPDATYSQLQSTITNTPLLLSREQALSKICIGVFPTDDADCDNVVSLPRILVRYMPDGTFDRSLGTFHRNQQLMVLIETLVPQQWHERSADSFTAQEIDGQDKIGRILTDCNTVIQSGTADRLQVEEWTFGPHGLITPEQSDGEWLRTCQLTASFMGAC